MKKVIKINIANYIMLLYFEVVFSLLIFNSLISDSIYGILIYNLFCSFLITIITTLFSEKINRILNYIIYFIIGFWFSLQFVFHSSMHTFFDFSLFKLSDQAVGFIGTTLKIIFNNCYGIIIFFIPLIMFILFRKRIKYNTNDSKKYLLLYLIIIPLSWGGYKLYLNSKKNMTMSIYDLYYKVDNIPLSIQKLGVLQTLNLDIKRSIFGLNREVVVVNYPSDDSIDVTKYEKNNLNIDFSSDKVNDNIKKYIENNSGTNKNKYSAFLEGKNLIFIVAESYDEIAVSQELTPTLYKLKNNGFVFNNFYVPYYLSTIGGEYQSLTGLYPDSSTLSIWKEGKNSFPLGLANSFKNKGYSTYAYHDHDGTFQSRNKYLKAIGFDNFRACKMGLDIECDVWPQSDIQMIKESYSDYINSSKPFLVYYMTVSGHMEYKFDSNNIASKNKNMVENLPYSESVKAYLATQIELDRALELLIKKLEDANKLDDTVIVLLADHYPYALTLNEINELSSYQRDELFEINHNSLIIWNNKLDRIEIDKVGMPIDVIPTIYNLFGIDYDSRLFAGSDILSSSEGLVILNNGSWITDYGKYNSIDNFYVGEGNKEYIDKINNIVQNKIIFSKDMIINDGYKYINID